MKKRHNNGANFLVLKALGFFIDNPYTEIYLREFARKLRISPNSSQRFLNIFLKEKFIAEFRKGNLRYFKANLDSVSFRHIKISFSLKKLENSGVIDYLKGRFPQVVLFGSIAKGTDDLQSDIDILCIGVKTEINLSEFERKLGREISLHFFSPSQWKKQKEDNKAFYQDIISAGISLIGEIPV